MTLAVPEARRVPAIALIAGYIGAVALSPWLPGAALATIAAATGAALAAAARRGRGIPPAIARAFGVPIHLLVLASGGAGSPLLSLVAPWGAWVLLPLGPRARAFATAAGLLVLFGADAWRTRTASLGGALAAAAAAAAALIIARWFDALRRRAVSREALLDRILDEADADRRAGAAGHAARRLDELRRELDRLRVELNAARAVLWDVDPELGRASPRVSSGGRPPGPVRMTGDPMGWAWEEGLPLRLETPPRWAADAARACILPLERRGGRAALLTLSFDAAHDFPPAEALDEAGDRVRAFLRMQGEEARAIAARERFAHLADVLRRLPAELATDAFARELAEAGIRLAGGTGACLASWEDEAGCVLATAGDDGGPAVGARFGPLECELALAARHAATLVRRQRRATADRIPIAARDERWTAEPTALVVVPLRELGQGVIGVLAVWSSTREALDPENIKLLEALAPYAAIQYRHTRMYGALREHAERDALTGLHNRGAFDARLEDEVKEHQRYRRPVALIMLDVDHFKRINDTHGHEAGDAVLRAVAAAIRASTREADHAARFGGEEFAILLPETGVDGAQETAERLRRRVEAMPVDWHGRRIDVRVSLGVSAVPDCVADPSALVASADAALYASKQAGRNRVSTAVPAVDAGR